MEKKRIRKSRKYKEKEENTREMEENKGKD